MTKRQFEREQARQTRARILRLLEVSRENSYPQFAVGAAGFWLERFPGAPNPQRNFRLRLREPEREPAYFGA